MNAFAQLESVFVVADIVALHGRLTALALGPAAVRGLVVSLEIQILYAV